MFITDNIQESANTYRVYIVKLLSLHYYQFSSSTKKLKRFYTSHSDSSENSYSSI